MIESIEAQSRALQVGKASNVGLISGTSGHRRPNGAAQMLPTLVLPQMTNWWKCVITLLRLSVFVSMYRRLCILFLHIFCSVRSGRIKLVPEAGESLEPGSCPPLAGHQPLLQIIFLWTLTEKKNASFMILQWLDQTWYLSLAALAALV